MKSRFLRFANYIKATHDIWSEIWIMYLIVLCVCGSGRVMWVSLFAKKILYKQITLNSKILSS